MSTPLRLSPRLVAVARLSSVHLERVAQRLRGISERHVEPVNRTGAVAVVEASAQLAAIAARIDFLVFAACHQVEVEEPGTLELPDEQADAILGLLDNDNPNLLGLSTRLAEVATGMLLRQPRPLRTDVPGNHGEADLDLTQVGDVRAYLGALAGWIDDRAALLRGALPQPAEGAR